MGGASGIRALPRGAKCAGEGLGECPPLRAAEVRIAWRVPRAGAPRGTLKVASVCVS